MTTAAARTSSRSRWRGPLVVTLSLTVILGATVPVGHVTADEAAERAAREILQARERANAAAQAAFDAESRLDQLDIELAQAELDHARLESEVGKLRTDLTDAAVRRFVGSGRDPLLLFTDIEATNGDAAAAVYTGAVTGSELVRADDYEQAIDDLDAAHADIARRRTETDNARENYLQLAAAAEAEVV